MRIGDEEGDAPEQRWERLAEWKSYRCSRCSHRAIYEERQLYFETGMCSWCFNAAEKARVE